MKKFMVFAVLLAGCGIGDALKDAANDIKDGIVNSAIDTAVQAAIDGAEKAGGAGAVVSSDAEATVEVTDPESTIFGAKVVLQAGSFPEGVTQAVLTIVPGNVSGAGFHTAAAPASDYVASGPAISVELKSIPSAEDATNLDVIQPTKDATVTVPLVDAPATVTVTADVFLAHIGDTGMVDPITGTVNAEGNRVSGPTASFSPFVAAREVVPPVIDPCDMSDVVEGEMSLDVTGADTFTANYDQTPLCSADPNITMDANYVLANSSDTNVWFKVSLSLAEGKTLSDIATGEDVILTGNTEVLRESSFQLVNGTPNINEVAQPGANTSIRITLAGGKADVCIQHADEIPGFPNGNADLDYVQPVIKFRCSAAAPY